MQKEKENSQTSQNNNTSAIRQSQGPLFSSSSRSIDIVLCLICELFSRYSNPYQAEEVNCMSPTSKSTPDHLEAEGWWRCLFITDHRPWLGKHCETPHYHHQAGSTVLRLCLLWPSLPGQTVKLLSFYFTQLFLKGFILHHCTEAGFWQQIGRSVWGWLRGSPTGVPWLDQTLRGQSSTPGSFEKAEGWKIPSEARWPETLVKKAELQSYQVLHPGSGASESEVESEGGPP